MPRALNSPVFGDRIAYIDRSASYLLLWEEYIKALLPVRSMSDPKNNKKKSQKKRQIEDKNTVPSSDETKETGPEEVSSVEGKLQELEDRYVTRPANVRPPLPDENPGSIKKSGIQKAYNPDDITLFPEESVYAMEPFILEEHRLNPMEEESFDDGKGASEDSSSTQSGSLESQSPIPAPDLDDDDSWEKTKSEFGGEGAWGNKGKEAENKDDDLPWSSDSTSDSTELDQAVEEEDMKDFSLLGEDSIYELEPIVLAGFDRLLNPDVPERADELPEVGPETVESHVSEDTVLDREEEPFKPEERFPEFSNYEIEPIRVDEQLTKDSGQLSEEPKSDEEWSLKDEEEEPPSETSDTLLEPGLDPLGGAEDRGVAQTLHEVKPVEVKEEDAQVEQKDEVQKEELEEEEREVAKTIHELDPIQIAEQDRLTAPPETQEVLDSSDDDAYERKVESTLMEVEVTRVESPLHETAPDAVAESGAEEAARSDTDSQAQEQISPDESDSFGKRRTPLIDLAFSEDISTHVDAVAIQSEHAAIAKEIQTQESLSAVRESAIRRSLVDPGIRDVDGQTLEDRYIIRGIIGQGGISVVYKAQDLPTGQIVAVKTLKESNPDVSYRFSKEIETLSKLNHKNIVRAIESISCSDGRVYLIMEHIKGISLQELVKQYGRAEHPEIIASILTQVCDGLGHAHEHKIVHRDLKGGNIVLTNVNEKIVIKILDFGIAKLEDDMQRVTHEGKAMGSPLYMSPEQCRGQPLTIRSDIYSLGIVAYELITGELPVKGRSIVSVMAQHCDPNFRPVPMSKLRPELPAVHMLDQIIFKALETDASNRIQLTEQFKRGIEYWIESVRARNYKRIIPKELLYSEELEKMTKAPEVDESINEIYEARNQAMATGAKYSDVLRKKENEKEKSRSFAEYLSTEKGLKFYVVGAAVVIFVSVLICMLLIKSMGH